MFTYACSSLNDLSRLDLTIADGDEWGKLHFGAREGSHDMIESASIIKTVSRIQNVYFQ
jgi:hypothetical protein